MKTRTKHKAVAILMSLALAFTTMNVIGIGQVHASGNAVAKIADQEYETLAAAVRAAGSSHATITLISDTQEGIVIPEYADITINLNGHTIKNIITDPTNVVGTHTFENYGKLELFSKGGKAVIDNVVHAKACVMNHPGGEVTISGDVELSRSNLPLPQGVERGSWYNICNRGTMTINEGVEVINNDTKHTAVTTGFLEAEEFFNNGYPEAKLTINGGHFTGKLNAFKVDSAGILEINDGTIENPNGVAIISWNELKINGGTINAAVPLNLNRYLSAEPPKPPIERGITEINGGTFTCAENRGMFTRNGGSIGGAVLTINDGTFNGSFSVLERIGNNSEGVPYIDCNVNGGKFKPDPEEYVKLSDKKDFVLDENGYYVAADHEWEEATCEKPMTCKNCEKREGSALGHDYRYEGMIWAEDLSSATAKFVCKHDTTHIENIPAEVTSKTIESGICETHGVTIYTATATYNGVEYKDTKEVGIDPKNHDWSDAEYRWSEDNSMCIASMSCSKCGIKEIETGVVMSEVGEEATCEAEGKMLFEASFKHDAFKLQDKEVPIPQLGHDYHYQGMAWKGDYSSATAKFVCKRNHEHTDGKAADVTSKIYGGSICETHRVVIYTATATYEGVDYKDTAEVGLDPEKHSWNEAVYSWSKDNTLCYASTSCSKCGIKESETAVISKTISEPATCSGDGKTLIKATFKNDIFKTQEKTEAIPKTGHKYGAWTGLDAMQHKCVCEHDKNHFKTENHSWDDGRITKEATATAKGTKLFTCKICGATKEEAIDSQMGADGTPVGPGASAQAADKAITSLKKDVDPKGTVFGKLQLKSTSQKKTSVKIAWKKVGGAKKYVIYGNACGTKNKMKKLVTVTGKSKNFKKVAGKKVKKGTYYKFIVVALDKENKVVTTSKMIHAATKGGKVGNHKSITVKAKVGKKTKTISKLNIKKGKTSKLRAKQNPVSKKKKVAKHVGVRYETSNAKVATVTSKGVIKAKKKGSCRIYVYAQNGIMKNIKVSVK